MLGDILKKADKIINGERQDSYGSPEDCFADIAYMWDAYLTVKYKEYLRSSELDSADVAFMMSLLKIVRELHNHKEDNLVDCVGYIDIANNLIEGDIDE